ncbi:unnamed protein product [Cyclocybe aegerita]|uniref:PB1 domain-containing protein n=1 Tax=Cyclocybe aegerita TaxID=1973307 RepID=A0A8S0XUC9_CYCAE|nr:unnamed protein product [Cyclocybe aegerita]
MYKEYRDSISSFKETSSLKIVTKLSRQKEVRRRKRQARKANQDLQEHFYASSSGTSDASSTTAESGSPPGSGLGDENIRQWALGIEDVPPLPPLPFMKVKVHFHEFLFVILVPMVTEYGYLVERIWRKVRLCGGCPDDGLLRVRYRDEDGDLITIGSTDDVQMVFEEHRPGGCVTVFVS